MNANEIASKMIMLQSGFMLTQFFVLCGLVLIALILQMKLVGEAGKHRWAVFVPFYNVYVFSQIAFGDAFGWVGFITLGLNIIPIFGLYMSMVLACYTSYCFAKAFNASNKVAVLYILFAPIVLVYWAVTKNYSYVGNESNLVAYMLNKEGREKNTRDSKEDGYGYDEDDYVDGSDSDRDDDDNDGIEWR